MTQHNVRVELGARGYDITIGAGVIELLGDRLGAVLPSKRVVILTDDTVAATAHLGNAQTSLINAGFAVDTITVAAGEGSKSFANYDAVMNQLLALRPDRNTTLIALGGGVVGDLTGFVASTCLRGIPFVQVPTTLLAMVDSSVGGKTGINTAFGKNLVGAFYQPKAVFADTDTLITLPKREFNAGYAEVVKYGLIDDPVLFDSLESGSLQVEQMVQQSCAAKARIVAADEHEKGQRALLNLGHTFGHALEAEMGYDGRLLHGEAVSIGMVMAFDYSASQGLCSAADARRVRAHLKAAGLKTTPQDVAPNWNAEALLAHMYHDKKAEGGTLTFILARGIGKSFVQKDVSAESVGAFLAKVVAA